MKFQTAVLIAALLALGSAFAQTDDKGLTRGGASTVTTALGTQWDITDTGGTDGGAFSGSCDSSPGFLIQDASSTTGDSDMYDNAWGIWVDGAPFAPPPFTVNGNRVTAGPASLSGLDVSMEYLFSDVIEAGRILATFTNPTGSPITVSVDVPANFGSDGSTTIVTTSSGDTTFSLADQWAITWDNSTEINTSVFYGPNGGVLPTAFTQTVFDCAGPEGLGATFDFTVPAGATQRLMFFAGIAEIDGTGDSDTANATANAQQFNQFETIDASLTSDLTPDQIASVLNWSPATAAPATSVPTLSTWALVLLGALMLGLASIVILRR